MLFSRHTASLFLDGSVQPMIPPRPFPQMVSRPRRKSRLALEDGAKRRRDRFLQLLGVAMQVVCRQPFYPPNVWLSWRIVDILLPCNYKRGMVISW